MINRTTQTATRTHQPEHLYAPPGSRILSFEEFREAYARQYGYYSRTFASRFTDGTGRPIDPDRQRKSYDQAERKRDKIAAEAYEQYVQLAKANGNLMPGDFGQAIDPDQLNLTLAV